MVFRTFEQGWEFCERLLESRIHIIVQGGSHYVGLKKDKTVENFGKLIEDLLKEDNLRALHCSYGEFSSMKEMGLIVDSQPILVIFEDNGKIPITERDLRELLFRASVNNPSIIASAKV